MRCSPAAARPGIETRGVSGHGFIDVVCWRDPDRHVIELTTKTADDREKLDPDRARRTDRVTGDEDAGLITA
jgi:hypothetical protein